MKDEYDFSNGKRGAIISTEGKTRVGIYLDTNVLDELRDQAEQRGMGRQTLINEVLTAYTSTDRAVFEALRRRANEQGISYLDLISDVLKSYVEQATFFENRVANGSREKYDDVLDKVPDVEPDKYDRMSAE